jgi:hypothetical protein
MDTITQQESLDNSRIEAQREVIRPILNDIAREVENRLREASLNVPVFLTVPNTGSAIATVATPADPNDDLWSSVVAIVTEIVSQRLDGVRLQSKEVACAMASAVTMSAADLVVE